MTWRRLALCRLDCYPADLWTRDNPTPAQTAEAKAVCRTCPVRQECLNETMAIEPPSRRLYIFGGYSPAERQRLYKRGRTAHGNAKADPDHVRQLVADYTATHGKRYGAIRHTAQQLGVHVNTVAAYLKDTAA